MSLPIKVIVVLVKVGHSSLFSAKLQKVLNVGKIGKAGWTIMVFFLKVFVEMVLERGELTGNDFPLGLLVWGSGSLLIEIGGAQRFAEFRCPMSVSKVRAVAK